MNVHTVITLGSGGTITIEGEDMSPTAVQELFALLASGGYAIALPSPPAPPPDRPASGASMW